MLIVQYDSVQMISTLRECTCSRLHGSEDVEIFI